jgi:hypothetical protein
MMHTDSALTVARERSATREKVDVPQQWLVSLAVGACVAALAYATARAVQSWTLPPYDPHAVAISRGIPFFRRATLALVCAAIASVGAGAIRHRFPDRFDHALPPLVVLTAVLTTLQAIFAP